MLPMRTVIFDIETKNTFEQVGSNMAKDLDISVVCLYDSQTDQYYSFLEDQFADMWPYFQSADLIVTYNGIHFDVPLLQKYTDIDLSAIKHIDLFKEIRDVTGKKLGLDGIAQATLGISKSGHGLDAIAWWNSGEIQKIIDYCIQDVKVTKDVYDYARKNQMLYFTNRATGTKEEIDIDTSRWGFDEEPEAQVGLFG